MQLGKEDVHLVCCQWVNIVHYQHCLMLVD